MCFRGRFRTSAWKSATIRKDGSLIWVNLTVGSARNTNATLDYFISVVEDITKRKEAEDEHRGVEAKLRESEAELQLAQEAANLGRWSWDLRTQDLTWTDRCNVLFGVPFDVPMSYGVFLSTLHPDDRERIDAAVSEAIRQGKDYDVEMRRARPYGGCRF